MNNNPSFSVLIANYNNGSYIDECIQSVYRQAYSNWEIIIVDDCSTDNSSDHYKKYTDDKRIKIFFNDQNRGCGYTKRKCVEYSSGMICGFLDPDDTLTPDALEEVVKTLKQNPDCSMVHSKFFYCDENLNRQKEYLGAENVPENISDFFNLDGRITHFVAFKRESYNKTVGIDPFLIRAVDQDLYLKLYETGKCIFIDKALYNYRVHNKGISTNTNARKAYFWHWMVIFSAIKRRKLNFENDFFNYFVPKHEYDYLLNKHDSLAKYKKIERRIRKIKSIFKR